MRLAGLSRTPGRPVPSSDAPPPPPVDVREFEEVPTALGPLWFDRRDEVMRPYIKHRQAWEENEGALLRALIKPGTRFLDVGANVGYFSLLAARAASHVIIDAVEPHPGNAAALRWNLWINHVAATVHQLALDDRRRHLRLQVTPTNMGDVRVSDRIATTDAIEVDAVPADELFAGRSFDVVKIDVQGWELEVIRGMQQTIGRSPGIVLVAEFWPTALRERDLEPLAVLDVYRALNLDVVTQVDDRLRRLKDEDIIEICDSAGTYGQVNLLLSHP
jgi:FkbM family methyltransferase